MKITLLGAGGGEVTGSAYLLQTRSANVLVDCGLFQGSRKIENFNRIPRQAGTKRLHAVVLTHAHLDHTGRLPLLARQGYQGPVYATQATIDLGDLILRDSARLQQADLERENRRRQREGQPLLETLYTQEDVDAVRPLFRAVQYDQPTEVAPGVTARLVDAGHILGSASAELTVEEQGTRRVLVFSGNLGPRGAPLHRDPVPFGHADLVFVESTYGNREHPSLAETGVEARRVIGRAVEARGKILVPVFAVGRTQLLLYLLAGAFQRGTLPPFPIYIDSPMAIEATRIYARHAELFDREALAMQQSGELREHLETVRFCASADESRALNGVDGPCLIMAGAGMCTGGRILHHLRNNLARPATTVLFTGYQSRGSLGRRLLDGAKSVTLFRDKIPVRASMWAFGGLSGHAGQKDLLAWIAALAPSRPRVIVAHGEEQGRQTLGRLIQERHGLQVEHPAMYGVVEA